MADAHDNVLQFRRTDRMSDEEHKRLREYHFGGCGPNQSFWPKRHRWGSWKVSADGLRRYRMCNTCALCSDTQYFEEGAWREADWEPAA